MTIRLVSHGTRDAVSLDKGSVLANPNPRFAEKDRSWNASKYERWFWSRLSYKNSDQLAELDRLVEQWFLKSQLLLAVDTPHLATHGDTIAQYLKWEIEKRGGAVVIVKPGEAPPIHSSMREGRDSPRAKDRRIFTRAPSSMRSSV